MQLCVICGQPSPTRWVLGQEGHPLVTATLCPPHYRQLAVTVSAALGQDEDAAGFSEILQERITTLEDLALRKRAGVA